MPLDSKPWCDPEAKPLDADGIILERAAEIIELRGWRQDDCGSPRSGPVCAGMAINLASGSIFWDSHLMHHMAGRLKLEGLIQEWNDAPGRTAAEVITCLRSAARRQPC